jgi:small multidrug resistance pump
VAWILLAVAITAEICATVALKYAEGFTRLWPSVAVIFGYLIAFGTLGHVAKLLPISLIYAIWSGVGTAAVAAIGFTVLGEPVNVLKVTGIALIIGGVVLLNVGGAH